MEKKIGKILSSWRLEKDITLYKVVKTSDCQYKNILNCEEGNGSLLTFCKYLSALCQISGSSAINLLFEICKIILGYNPKEIKKSQIDKKCSFLPCLEEVRDYLKNKGKISEIRADMNGVVFDKDPEWPGGNTLHQEELVEIMAICKKHRCRMSISTRLQDFGNIQILIDKEQ